MCTAHRDVLMVNAQRAPHSKVPYKFQRTSGSMTWAESRKATVCLRQSHLLKIHQRPQAPSSIPVKHCDSVVTNGEYITHPLKLNPVQKIQRSELGQRLISGSYGQIAFRCLFLPDNLQLDWRLNLTWRFTVYQSRSTSFQVLRDIWALVSKKSWFLSKY